MLFFDSAYFQELCASEITISNSDRVQYLSYQKCNGSLLTVILVIYLTDVVTCSHIQYTQADVATEGILLHLH